MKKHRIGILGLGAIGSSLAHELLQNDRNELLYFSRTKKKHLKVIANKVEVELPIHVATKPTESQGLDWLIVCLKEHQYLEAGEWLSQLIQPSVNIAVVRNGLRLKESILPFASSNNILECMIDAPTQLNEHGFYEQLSVPVITTKEGSLVTEFESLFNQSAVKISRTDNFKTVSWKKLCESASLGAILCLTGETCRIFKDQAMVDLYKDLLEESILVAKADGAEIEDHYLDDMLNKVMKYPRHKGSSMLADRLSGKPIELGAKNGVISKLGASYNIATPINDLVVKLLRHTNQKGLFRKTKKT